MRTHRHFLTHSPTHCLTHNTSITLSSTFPFVWKVAARMRDERGDWRGENVKDTRWWCQDTSLAPALCIVARAGPWRGRVNESGPTIDLAPPCLGIDPPHHTPCCQSHINGEGGIIPAAFCQDSMALWEAVLATSFVMIILQYYILPLLYWELPHTLPPQPPSFITIMD